MEIDNYRNFLAIVEAGSMTAASEYIHIAQPALSKQVKSLENYFGTKLIITTRGSKHLILTDAGRILYHKAKYICSLEDMAKNEIGDVSDGSKGTLRFTVANSRAAVFIKECLEPFHRLFPLINYEIHEGGITEQSQQLLSGIAELGILSVPPIHQNNFDVLFRRKEKIVCVTAENSMFLKGITTPTLPGLAECPLCLSTGCHLMMSKIFAEKSFPSVPRVPPLCAGQRMTAASASSLWSRKRSSQRGSLPNPSQGSIRICTRPSSASRAAHSLWSRKSYCSFTAMSVIRNA